MAANDGQVKKYPFKTAGEIGLWVAIVLLMGVAICSGSMTVAELQGSVDVIPTLILVANVMMWAGVAAAGFGLVALRVTVTVVDHVKE